MAESMWTNATSRKRFGSKSHDPKLLFLWFTRKEIFETVKPNISQLHMYLHNMSYLREIVCSSQYPVKLFCTLDYFVTCQ